MKASGAQQSGRCGPGSRWRAAAETVLCDPCRVCGSGFTLDQFWAAIARLGTVPHLTKDTLRLAASGSEENCRAMLAGRIPLSQGRFLEEERLNWANLALGGRTEAWLVEQWPFCREPIFEWSKRGTLETLPTAVRLIQTWLEVNLSPDAVEDRASLAWHDHATALRLQHLVCLLRVLVLSGRDPAALLPALPAAVVLHFVLLLDDEFYSRGTNHGFDQAYALLLAASSLELGALGLRARQTARERLREESRTAFNEEGVHIENTPTYHLLMMRRIVRGAELLNAVEDDSDPDDVDRVLVKATRFLASALRPDGRLPMFGDSANTLVRVNWDELPVSSATEELRFMITRGQHGVCPRSLLAVYPTAGYAFLRSHWEVASRFDQIIHLAMKCGLLSRYHRHDDDNAILLFAYGEDWLVGPGFYKYQEQDPYRIYLRSSWAHNLVSVEGARPVREVAASDSRLVHWAEDEQRCRVVGQSHMYPGIRYERRLELEPQARVITIEDTLTPVTKESRRFELRFHVPADKTLQVTSTEVIVSSGSGRMMVIDGIASLTAAVQQGKADEPMAGWWAPTAGKLEPVQTIILAGSSSEQFHSRVRLSFR